MQFYTPFFFFLFHFLASGLPCSFIIMHQNRYQQCIGVFILQAPTESVKVRGRTACWCNYTLCHLWSAPPDSSPMPPFSSRSNYSVLNVTSTNTLHARKGLLNARHWLHYWAGVLCVCVCVLQKAWLSEIEEAVGALLKRDSQQPRLKSSSLYVESSQI